MRRGPVEVPFVAFPNDVGLADLVSVVVAQIQELAQPHQQGILGDDEFAAAQQRLLG